MKNKPPIEIPASARAFVKVRDRDECIACCVGLNGRGHWHHRRSRSVRDDLTHSPANGILLCATDHSRVHADPVWARSQGYIVSRYSSPLDVPVMHKGSWVWLNGGSIFTPATMRGGNTIDCVVERDDSALESSTAGVATVTPLN